MRLIHDAPTHEADRRSIGQLIRDLRDDGIRLLRQELQLFGAEMRETVRSVASNCVMLLIGGSVLFFGLQALVVTACVGLAMLLAQVMPLQGAVVLGPLIVGIMCGIAGWVAVQVGVTRLKASKFWPQRTVEELKETKQWLSETARD